MSETKAPPYSLQVQLAAMRSDLPREAKHAVHVLAVAGDQDTGVGWRCQATIAQMMGATEKHVRTQMALLESRGWLERKPRFRTDGRGRTSDEWRLILVDVEAPVSTNRNVVPPERRTAGTPGTTNRNVGSDQPERRTEDLLSDLPSDLLSISRSSRAKKESKKAERRRGEPMPAKWQPNEVSRRQCVEWGLDPVLVAHKFVGHARSKGRLSLDWDATFDGFAAKACELAGGRPRQGPERVVSAPRRTRSVPASEKPAGAALHVVVQDIARAAGGSG